MCSSSKSFFRRFFSIHSFVKSNSNSFKLKNRIPPILVRAYCAQRERRKFFSSRNKIGAILFFIEWTISRIGLVQREGHGIYKEKLEQLEFLL